MFSTHVARFPIKLDEVNILSLDEKNMNREIPL